jgi:hypothetical protein
MALTIHRLKERPDLRPLVFSAEFRPPFWPEFLLHDPAARLYFSAPFFDRYLEYAFAGLADGKVVARAFSVPFAFGAAGRAELPDGGWDEVIRWAHADAALGIAPNAVSALEISLLHGARGAGNSRAILAAMKENAKRLGFASLFAPVRPSAKHLLPFLPMRDYVALKRPDGLPQDPWLRAHVGAGGSIVRIAPYAMTIVGTVAEWRRWTGMALAQSGPTAVAGALSPLHVSLEHDVAVYVEPGVWVHHPL